MTQSSTLLQNFRLVLTILAMYATDARTSSKFTPYPPLQPPARNSASLIPKIIHQTYTNESIPNHWKDAQQSCKDLHSDYLYILWTDEMAKEFIEKEYSWFLPTYLDYQYDIQRADAIRYFALAKYGGIYIDLDDGCNRKLDPLLQYSIWVRQAVPKGISNNIMGAVPAHPLFLRTIEQLEEANHRWILPYLTVMASTGPLFLSFVWKSWLEERPEDIVETNARLLTLAEYNRHHWSFFYTYEGSSWHCNDAKYIIWASENWKPIVAMVILVGIAVFRVSARLRVYYRQRLLSQDDNCIVD